MVKYGQDGWKSGHIHCSSNAIKTCNGDKPLLNECELIEGQKFQVCRESNGWVGWTFNSGLIAADFAEKIYRQYLSGEKITEYDGSQRALKNQ